MAQRHAVTKATALRYAGASKGTKSVILDELCQLTGWHRDHARKALRTGLGPRPARRKKRAARAPVYGEEVMVALRKVWAVMDAPAGKRLAPFLGEVATALERAGELDVDPALRARLCGMSAATIDRRLAPDWAPNWRSGVARAPSPGRCSRARSRSAPGPTGTKPRRVRRTRPGRTRGRRPARRLRSDPHCHIFSGWAETQAVKNKAQKWVFAALMQIRAALPFPLLGSTRTTAALSPARSGLCLTCTTWLSGIVRAVVDVVISGLSITR